MSVQIISLEAAQKIRHYIRTVLALPEAENRPRGWSSYQDVDELPEPESLSDLGSLFDFGVTAEETIYPSTSEGQWFISTLNPGAALLKLPGLRLKPALRLITYLYRTAEKNGSGVTWAVPEPLSTTAQLERALLGICDRTNPPQPTGALQDLMEAIEGDRSPASFIVASILRRELHELGALGNSQSWTHHRLIHAPPNQVKWDWQVEIPKDLSPKVRNFPDGRAATELFTCRVVAPVAIFQHVDQYYADNYKAVSLNRPVAILQKP